MLEALQSASPDLSRQRPQRMSSQVPRESRWWCECAHHAPTTHWTPYGGDHGANDLQPALRRRATRLVGCEDGPHGLGLNDCSRASQPAQLNVHTSSAPSEIP